MQRSIRYGFVMLLTLFLALSANTAGAMDDVGGRAYYDLGVFAYEDADFKGAEENFTMARKYEPDNAQYLLYLGKVYFKTDRLEEAESAFKTAVKLDPKLPGLKYDLAYLYYQKEDYTKATGMFEDVIKAEPDNVLALYYAALSYNKLRQYNAAADYFIAAAEKSPTVKDNGYYYAGTCYNNLGQLDNALEKFIYVRDNAENDTLTNNAVKYIQVIETKQKETKPYALYAKIGYMHDGNALLDPVDQDLPTEEEDGAVFAYLSGTYDFFKKDALKLGAGYSHYQTRYNSLRELDLMGSTVSFYAKYNLFPMVLGISVLPTHYWLDGDDYMERYQFRPEIRYTVNRNFFLKLVYGYHIINHLQFNDKDGYANDATVNFNYVLPKKLGYVHGGIGLEDYNAEHADEDFTRLKFSSGISLKDDSSGISLNLLAEFNDKQYDNVDSFYNVKRTDDKYYFSISLSRKIIYDWMSISLEYNYTKNNSNIKDYTYKKNAGNLALTVNL